MQALASLIGLVGLLLAVGHPFYVSNFSGKVVGTYELKVAGPVRSPQRYVGPVKYRPIELTLDPSMNPVMFNWVGRIWFENNSEFSFRSYSATLSLGQEQVLSKSIDVKGDKGVARGDRYFHSRVVEIGQVNVPSAGSYRFELLDRPSHNETEVEQLRVEVRRNVKATNYKIVGGGIVLIVLASVITWLTGKPGD